MRNLTTLQQAALDILEFRHKDNEITGVGLSAAIGLKPRQSGKSGADLRAIINALRSKGYPVCANGKGYWYPRGPKELEEYIIEFQGRIDSQQKALNGMKAGYDRLKPKIERVEIDEKTNTARIITKQETLL